MKQIQTVIFKIFLGAIILLCSGFFLSWANTSLKAAEQEKSSILPTHHDETINNCGESYTEHRIAADTTDEETERPEVFENEDASAEMILPVNNDFNNTLFIGDSLTVGLKLYGGLSDADYFCITGIGVNGIRNTDMNGVMLDTKLESTLYRTIYIMLGINDIGIDRESFLSSYRDLLNYIHEKQPDADIIIQSILVVTASYTNSNPIFNNDEVRARNNELSDMADNDRIFYLDLNNYFMDSNGNLYDNLSTDGCHLAAAAYGIWTDVLLNYNIP